MESLITPPPIRELPQVRKISTLAELQPTSTPVVQAVASKSTQKGKGRFISWGLILVGTMLFGALGLALFTINRLDQSNKEYSALYQRIYQISLAQKSKIASLEGKLQFLGKVRDRLAFSRGQVMNGYRRRSAQYQDQKSQFLALKDKEKAYQRLLAAKTALAGIVQADLSLASAKFEAMQAQQKVLIAQVNEQTARVGELTSNLLKNINERKSLLRKNLMLRQELAQNTSNQQNTTSN